MPYYHAAYSGTIRRKHVRGVRTTEAGKPFHAVLNLIQTLGLNQDDAIDMNVLVFEFQDGDMYHDGHHPAEEKEFAEKMYGGKHRFYAAFDVTCRNSLNVIKTHHGQFEGALTPDVIKDACGSHDLVMRRQGCGVWELAGRVEDGHEVDCNSMLLPLSKTEYEDADGTIDRMINEHDARIDGHE